MQLYWDCNPPFSCIMWATIFLKITSRKIFSLEKFRGHQLIRENRETFPPRTICNIRYIRSLSYSALSSVQNGGTGARTGEQRVQPSGRKGAQDNLFI